MRRPELQLEADGRLHHQLAGAEDALHAVRNMRAVAFRCADDIDADDDIGNVHQALVGHRIADAAVDHHPVMRGGPA